MGHQQKSVIVTGAVSEQSLSNPRRLNARAPTSTVG
jgi:hypothetical protein